MVSQNQRHRMFDIRKNVEIQIVNIYRHVQWRQRFQCEWQCKGVAVILEHSAFHRQQILFYSIRVVKNSPTETNRVREDYVL